MSPEEQARASEPDNLDDERRQIRRAIADLEEDVVSDSYVRGQAARAVIEPLRERLGAGSNGSTESRRSV